jgi:hypothetical protein
MLNEMARDQAGYKFRVNKSDGNFPDRFIFSPLPNVLTLTLNAIEIISIILELRRKSDVNLVRVHAFFVEKADDNSLIMLHS